jgi:hypothetical protein
MKSSAVAKVTDPCHTLTASQRGHYLFVVERQNERHILNAVNGQVFLINNVLNTPASLSKVKRERVAIPGKNI